MLPVIPDTAGGFLSKEGVIAPSIFRLFSHTSILLHVASGRRGVRVRSRSAWWALTYALKDPGGLRHRHTA